MSDQKCGKRSSSYHIDPKSLDEVEEGDKQIPLFQEISLAINNSNPSKSVFERKESKSQNKQCQKSLPLIQNERNKKKNEKQSLVSKSALFSFSNGTGLFSSESLFGTNLLSQGSNKQQIKSIFNFETKGIPQIKFNGNEKAAENNCQSSGDEASLQDSKQDQIDKGKSTGNYVYQNTKAKILLMKPVKKYKKNNQSVVENVEIEIICDCSNNNKWVVVRLPETKNPIMTAYIIKNMTTFKHINNKKENIQIGLFEVKSGSLSKITVRLQLEKITDAEDICKELQKHM